MHVSDSGRTRVAVLGASGALGDVLVRELRAEGHDVVGIDRAAGADRTLDLAADPIPDDLLQGAGAVLHAAGLDPEVARRLAERSLEAGAHWIDLDGDREAVLAGGELDDLAKEAKRIAVSGAGVHCGLTAPFAAQLADGLVRVNEILIGDWVDPAARGPASRRAWLSGFGRPIRMAIGGEWTEREPFGDRRRFAHPSPVGERVSENLDAPDLELFAGRGFRSSSVRVSLAVPTGLERRALHAGGRAGAAGAERAANRLAALGRLFGRGRRSSAVTWIVRGIDPHRLPVERRLSVIAPARELVHETAAALLFLRQVLRGDAGEPGAGPLVGRVSAEELEQELLRRGATVVRGDLGGWKAPVSGAAR